MFLMVTLVFHGHTRFFHELNDSIDACFRDNIPKKTTTKTTKTASDT